MTTGYRHLLDQQVQAGTLDVRWRRVFEEVPRRAFVPPVALADEGHNLVTIDQQADPDGWLAVVTSNRIIVTQMDDGGAAPGGLGHRSTSSCSMPTMVAKMLTACRINDGMRVLEIGTGTGWNAALLARRLGDDRIVTVEIDHQLADRARKALAEMGLHPRVIAGDGELGWPAGSPYDRVLSTCTVHHIPYPWVEQTAPGGLIITPWRDPFCHQGKLLRLQVGSDGTAAGRFIDWASFMRSRTQRVPDEEVPTSGGEQSTTDLHPGFPLDGEHAETAIGATVSNCQWWREDLDNDRFEVRLDDVTSRSWASVGPLDGDYPAPYPVRQGGPRRLWDEVVAAYRWWEESGSPEYTRFAITVSRDRQLVRLAR